MSRYKVHLYSSDWKTGCTVCGKDKDKVKLFTDMMDEVTCILCKGEKKENTLLQTYSYQYSRLLGDIAMVRSCLRRIHSVTWQSVDWANIDMLDYSIRKWYRKKKQEEAGKFTKPRPSDFDFAPITPGVSDEIK